MAGRASGGDDTFSVSISGFSFNVNMYGDAGGDISGYSRAGNDTFLLPTPGPGLYSPARQ